jgi:hypothetical protein
MQTGRQGSGQEQNDSADAGWADTMVDQAAERLAARDDISVATAWTGLRITEALRVAADRHPDLTDAEALEALRAVEVGVRHIGVPRRPAQSTPVVADPLVRLRSWLADLHDEDRCTAHGEGVRCCFDILDEIVVAVGPT